MLLSIVLDIIDIYLDLDIVFNKNILDIDLDADFNQILFLKELDSDNEKVTIILCVKITMVTTTRYTFDIII